MKVPVFAIIIILAIVLYNPFPILTAFVSTADIQSLTASPTLYQNKELTLFGKVVGNRGPLNLPMYRLADQTGDIWVLYDEITTQPPANGAYIILSGHVEEINILGFKLGTVMGENKRLFASTHFSPQQPLTEPIPKATPTTNPGQ